MIKTAILFVVMLLVLVIPHEWGHMIVAKLCGVKVNEFSVGMGPLLFKKQKGETQYSVRLLPLGGYCAMEGEENAVDDPRSYSSKTPLQKIAILLALVLALGLLGAAYYLICCLGGALMFKSQGKLNRRSLPGVFGFPIFLFSWMPINVYAFFTPPPKWQEIRHVRGIDRPDTDS